jgi:hypothetical protein
MTLLPVERLTSSDPALLVQAPKSAGDPFGELMRALFDRPAPAEGAADQSLASLTVRADHPRDAEPPAPRTTDGREQPATAAPADPPRAASDPTPDKGATKNDPATAETAATNPADGTGDGAKSADTRPAKDTASKNVSDDGVDMASKSEETDGGDDPTARALALQGFAQALANSNGAVAPAVLAALSGNEAAAPGAIAEVATAAAGGVARGLPKAGGPASAVSGSPAAGTPVRADASQAASQAASQPPSATPDPAPAARTAPGNSIQATVTPPDGTALLSRPSSTLAAPSTLALAVDSAATVAAADTPAGGAAPVQPFAADADSAKGAAQASANMPTDASALLSSLQASAPAAGNTPAGQPGQPAATAQDTPGPQAGTTVQSIAPAAGLGTDARVGAAAQPQSVNIPRPAAAPPAPADQVAVHITKAIDDGLDRITIQLRPEHLGRIDVRLDVASDGRVTAAIAADRPDTLNLLQRDAGALARALQDAGLRADAGSLSFNLGGQNQGGSGPFGMADASAALPSAGVPVVETEPLAPPLPASSRAAAGGVDIRV